MVDESGVETMDDYEWVFTKLEIQVTDISHNMSIIMVAQERKFEPLVILEALT